MGGVVDTWHSYVPESRRWGYFTCSVQSSVWGKCDATNLWSEVYVSTPTVRRWISLCLTHDTWKTREKNERGKERTSRRQHPLRHIRPQIVIRLPQSRAAEPGGAEASDGFDQGIAAGYNLSGSRYCGRVKMIAYTRPGDGVFVFFPPLPTSP